MSGNDYSSMADLFKQRFGRKKVAVFPVDHGGAVQAERLAPYLDKTGVNFTMYQREGTTRPQEDCIDQGNLHLYEVRQIVTPRRRIRRYLRDIGGAEEIALLDDWATSRTMPSLGGAWVYFVMLGYPNATTAVFRDRCGGADISPDRKSEDDRTYKGTRDYLRQHDPNISYYLLGNGYLPFEPKDWIFSHEFEKSSLGKKAMLYLKRRADQLLVTPLARQVDKRMKNGDFIKDSTDRMLRSATML